MVRRRFGYIRKLPSGRFQASYKTPDGQRHNAPETYRSEADAGRFLDRMQQESASGGRKRVVATCACTWMTCLTDRFRRSRRR